MLKRPLLPLTLTAVALLTGPLCPAGRALVITEIMYHPSDAGERLEFVELYNDRAVTEDLGAWAFTQGIGYTFPDDLRLGPKSYLVLARDPQALETAYGIGDVLGPYTGRLSNSGERLTLTHPNGETILSVAYSDEQPWPLAPDGTGHSLTRLLLGGDPEEGRSWGPSTFLGGTPGAPDQDEPVSVEPTVTPLVQVGDSARYFEGRTEPPSTWTQVDFDDSTWPEGASGFGYSSNSAELQTVGTPLPDMRGQFQSLYVRLAFDLDADQIAGLSQLQAEITYDDGFVLYLNGARVGDSGNLPGTPPAFDQGTTSASDYGPMVLDLTPVLFLLRPGRNVLAAQGHNASLSGSSDFVLTPTLRAVSLPVLPPAEAPDARLLINEVAVSPSGWIELFNPGPEPVALDSLAISNDAGDLTRRRLGAVTLQPGDHDIVTAASLGWALSPRGATLYITALDGQGQARRVLDAVRYPAIVGTQSTGRYPSGAAHWETFDSPTPGASNRDPRIADIVINEIMYHHPTAEDRYGYVELWNRGTQPVSLGGWAFTRGIGYTFAATRRLAPGDFLVVAQDPNTLAALYPQLVPGDNLVGPFTGRLGQRRDTLRLSRPHPSDADTWLTVDEVTYYDGGTWPHQADGGGSSLELRDPDRLNHVPAAWGASDESGKTTWEPFEVTIPLNDPTFTHDTIDVVDLMLLHRGEVLLDDLEVLIGSTGGGGRATTTNRIRNGDFETGTSNWRLLGNHIRSHVVQTDAHGGQSCLHLVATGHGDPGANRINQSVGSVDRGAVTFRGWARWLSGCPYLLIRTAREQAPVQPPRPSQVFTLTRPLALGTPGLPNTALTDRRGPDITGVTHRPPLPRAQEPIVVEAQVTSDEALADIVLAYRSEGQGAFTRIPMVDDGSGADQAAGDQRYTGVIPGAAAGTMRAFTIEATDAETTTRFPTRLPAYATVPERTCLVRVGDTHLSTRFATYRVWMSNQVVGAFQARPSLSNQLLDCTFVYRDREVFYNAQLRLRGSPFLRRGFGRDPRDRWAYRIEFNPEQRFRTRQEINLDNTESANRGPLQERASYWFFEKLGLPFSRQEYVRPILNGHANGIYEDVQKIDGDYIDRWFGSNNRGHLHKIDDYFEYAANGDGFRNLDEGLKHDSRHPLIPETYRWGFEKRSHRENDSWDHLFALAVTLNSSPGSAAYEPSIEGFLAVDQFLGTLALEHAVGNWDSYGFERGKNGYLYHSLPEDKWYFLPWDIDFTLGSGRGPNQSLFSVSGGEFPEIAALLNHPTYRQRYLQVFAHLVDGPWRTSFGTAAPPTAFDRFLDEAADALQAEGLGGSQRDRIKAYVRDRRAYMTQAVQGVPR